VTPIGDAPRKSASTEWPDDDDPGPEPPLPEPPPAEEPVRPAFVSNANRRVRDAGEAARAKPRRKSASITQQYRIFACLEIGSLAKTLAVYILNRAAGRGNGGVCRESVAELGRACGAHPRQINRALRELADVGWLTTRKQWNGPADRSVELP
jgi:hypothetical protein